MQKETGEMTELNRFTVTESDELEPMLREVGIMKISVSDGGMTYSATFPRCPSERQLAWAYAGSADYDLRENEVLGCRAEYEDGRVFEFGLALRNGEIVPMYIPPYAELIACRVVTRGGREVTADECERIPHPRRVPKVKWVG